MSFEVRCDTCDARFALGDDLYERKVKGRLVTIKCKKCGAGISVDGTGATADATALPPVEEVVPSDEAPTEIREVGPAGVHTATPTVPLTGERLRGSNELEPTPTQPLELGAAVWLVSFTETDDRELDAGKIAEAIGNGDIDANTIVWRDGMADWTAISGVPELADALAKGKALRAKPPSPTTGGFLGTGMKLGGGLGGKSPEPTKAPTPVAKVRSPEPPKLKTPEPAKVKSPQPPKLKSPEPPKAAPATDDDEEEAPISLEPESLDPESLKRLQQDDPGAAMALSPGTLGAPKAPKPPPRADKGKPSLPTPKKAPKPPSPKKGGPELESLSDEKARLEDRVDEDFLGLGGGAPIMAPVNFDAPTAPIDIASIGADEPAPSSRGKKKKKKKSATSDAEASAAPPLATASVAAETPTKQEEKRGSPLVFVLVAAALAVGGYFVLFKQDAPKEPAPERTTRAETAPAPSPEPATAPEPAAPQPAEQEPAAEPAKEPAPEEPAKAEPATGDPAEPPSKSASVASKGEAPKGPAKEAAEGPSKTEPAKAEPAKAEPAKTETPKEEPKKEVAVAGDFDAAAARASLGAAAGAAAGCRKADDPSGTARVTITFAPSGRVTSAVVSGPPFAGTATGGCIASAMRSARVPPFSGSPVTVGKTVLVN